MIDYDGAAQEIVAGCLHMTASGLVTGTSGNVSIRLSDSHVAISPGQTPYESLTPEDISLVSVDGTHLAGRKPSSELDLHLGLYRTTEHRAIVHTHSPVATAVGTVVSELPAIHYAIHRLGDTVPVVPYATFGSLELAGNVTAALAGGRRAALMQNHGTVTVGSSLSAALSAAETLESLCTLFWRASMLGTPHVLDPSQLAAVRDQVKSLEYLG